MNKQYIRQLIGSDDPVLLEIGAGDGVDTREFVETFKDTNFRLYAFEPDPRNVQVFASTIYDERVVLFDGVVGNVDGRVDFYQSTHNRDTGQEFIYSSSLREPTDKLFETWPVFQDRNNFKKIKVNSVRLDTFTRNTKLKRVDYVWLDCQGAEDMVFEGGIWTFKNIVKYLYTECNSDNYYVGAPSLTKMLAMLPDFEVVEDYGTDVLLKNKRL